MITRILTAIVLSAGTLVAQSAPPNDSCMTPSALFSSNAFDTTLATTGSEGQIPGPGHCSIPATRDVWFVYVSLVTGQMQLSTCATGGVKIAVYSGAGCPTAPPIQCSSFSSVCLGTSSPFTSVTISLTCGQTVLMQVGSTTGNAVIGTLDTFLPFGTTGCQTPTVSSCTGGTPGTTCLACGNNGAANSGCANSSSTVGSRLQAFGIASVSSPQDTFELWGDSVTGPAMFIQASGLSAAPLAFGDGQICVTTGILRLGVMSPSFGVVRFPYPAGSVPPMHVAGGPLNAGDVRHYQCWYRDSAAFCTSATFNMSNALTLTWGP